VSVGPERVAQAAEQGLFVVDEQDPLDVDDA
jgi:hypothetical protein